MSKIEPISGADMADTEVVQFTESFETFNRIINNLQRQYLTLEKEHGRQGLQLAEINHKLRKTIAANSNVTSFLNSILKAISAAVIAIDRQGRISHLNPAAEHLLEKAAQEIKGMDYEDAIRSPQNHKYSALATIQTGVEVNSEEKVVIAGDGRDRPMSISTSLLRDNIGRTRGAVEILFDLTKLKKLEVEMSRIKTLAALGEMAATVAHEVRNPLGGIGGFAALLKREVAGDEEKERLVDKIITGVNTLNTTVEALLAYTRKDQINIREVPLSRLIEECVEFERADQENSGINSENGNKVSIDVLVGDRELKLNCDPHLMRQVLANLLRNSREAMPEGGRITILADRVKDDVQTAVKGPAIWIEVEDTGSGIDEKIREKIFQPFFSTKSGANGSGLGLATVWKAVQAHGGDVTVTSRKGSGSTFRITLPLNI